MFAVKIGSLWAKINHKIKLITIAVLCTARIKLQQWLRICDACDACITSFQILHKCVRIIMIGESRQKYGFTIESLLKSNIDNCGI